jgi:pyridoxal phosphate enzyme (YggS family)
VNIIIKNIDNIKKRIAEAAKGGNVTLVAVTKTFSAEEAEEAVKNGVKDIAESKIQEALPKFDVLSNKLDGINKHFIGHLQSNKAKKAVQNFDLIQSLDSINLADSINKYAKDTGKLQKCLIELKVSKEESKFGVTNDKVYEIYRYCSEKCKNISISGIMTIAPYFENKEDVRPYFKLAYSVFNDLKQKSGDESFKILSMGMSSDFEVAIQEGSNMVRIGSAIFGERNYDK